MRNAVRFVRDVHYARENDGLMAVPAACCGLSVGADADLSQIERVRRSFGEPVLRFRTPRRCWVSCHDYWLTPVSAGWLNPGPAPTRVRRQTVEHPFGTLKCWMGATHFLTKTRLIVVVALTLNILFQLVLIVLAVTR